MSAPPGFNPNASLLPDPGPSAAPIQVMKGGGKSKAQKGGAFTAAEETQLALYQLHSNGGVIASEFNEDQKRMFLKQVADTSRCRRTAGDSIILGKDCDMVVKVIRALLNAKIKRGNTQEPVPSAPASPSVTTGEPEAPSTPTVPKPDAPATPAAPGETPAEPAKPASEGNANNLKNENVEGLHEFANNNLSTPTEKPSPCKNRGKTQRNASNTASTGSSVNEEEREAANAAAAATAAARRGGGKKTRKNRKSKK